jgi:hypothetical protein
MGDGMHSILPLSFSVHVGNVFAIKVSQKPCEFSVDLPGVTYYTKSTPIHILQKKKKAFLYFGLKCSE